MQEPVYGLARHHPVLVLVWGPIRDRVDMSGSHPLRMPSRLLFTKQGSKWILICFKIVDPRDFPFHFVPACGPGTSLLRIASEYEHRKYHHKTGD